MKNTLTLKTFLDEYGESLAEKAAAELKVVHDPDKEWEEELDRIMGRLHKDPFRAQRELAKAVFKSFRSGNRCIYVTAEMGVGKTLISIAAACLLKKNPRVLVLCPPHLVRKWILEIKDALPTAKAVNLNGKHCLDRLRALRDAPLPAGPEFYIIGKERAKTGPRWRPAAIRTRYGYLCPKCGQELLDHDGVPMPIFELNTQGQFKKKYSCANLVPKWKWDQAQGKHVKHLVPCEEQLWQADGGKKNRPRPMPAQYIKDKLRGVFDLLIADECHMFKNQTGQGWAFAALVKACRHTLCLTGTLAGGYASDLYYLLFRTHPRLMVEDGNKWGNQTAFMEKYGVLERITTVSDQDGLTTKARKKTVIRARPGISPLLLGKMLLPNSVFLRLSDFASNLAPYKEEVCEIAMSPKQADCYRDFEAEMREALLEALARGDNSLLGSYLNSLLSYPERIYQGLQVFHPHTNELVAYGHLLAGVMPKEQELLDIIRRECSIGRRVLVYIQNSNTTDISPRLKQLMEEQGHKVKVLRAGNTESRGERIDAWVKDGIDVLICNPKLVEVGLDLLFAVTIVFYQCGYSTYTLRQAARRSWRIPQNQPVKVYFLCYQNTMQTRAMKLMADKLTCSLAVEGELTDKGLAALSDTSDSMARELARMLVEKVEDNRSIKDLWAGYRKKEVMIESVIKDVRKVDTRSTNDNHSRPGSPKTVSFDAEQIGDKVVTVEFIEYSGKRPKKVTRVEVRQAELEQMLSDSKSSIIAQFALF